MKSLLLALCVAATLRAQSSDPTTQLLNTLNTASLQLQALGTLTLNNNTFVQLVQVLNTVFGSLSNSALPFYYTQMNSISSLNTNLANRLFQVNSTMNSVYSALANYVTSMNNNFALQLSQIGNQLQDFQLDAQDSLDLMEEGLGLFYDDILPLNDKLAVAIQNNTLLAPIAANDVTQTQVLLTQIPGVTNPHNKTVDNIDLSQVTLGSTALSYCKSFIYGFPLHYAAIPSVGLDINLESHETAANSAYDLVLASTTTSSATIWICDRSMATFTLRPATLFVAVWL